MVLNSHDVKVCLLKQDGACTQNQKEDLSLLELLTLTPEKFMAESGRSVGVGFLEGPPATLTLWGWGTD